MANAVLGLIGFACACVVLHFTAVPLGAAAGLSLALATSVSWSLIVLTARRHGIDRLIMAVFSPACCSRSP